MTQRLEIRPRAEKTPGFTYFAESAVRGRALAEQRLAYLTELYDSGRWRRFHTEIDFLLNVRTARAAVDAWRRIEQFDPGTVRPSEPEAWPASIAPEPMTRSASIVALLESRVAEAEPAAPKIEMRAAPSVAKPLRPVASAVPPPEKEVVAREQEPAEPEMEHPQAAPEPIETSAPIIALLERRMAVDSQRAAEAEVRRSLLPPVMFSTYGIGAERNLLKA